MKLSLAILIILPLFTSGDDKHLICKQVDDVFSEVNENADEPTGGMVQGRPGKRGISGVKGDRGDVGPPGPPALVNYTKIESTVRPRISSEIDALSEQVAALDRRLAILEKRSTTVNCDVFHDGKCFRAILHDSQDVQYNAAQTMCRDIGWDLANIYDDAHYTKIENYLRSKIPASRTSNSAWLGMTIIPATKELRYSDGAEASGVKWVSGYPYPTSSYTKIGIYVNRDTESNQGIHNYPPGYVRLGPICEF